MLAPSCRSTISFSICLSSHILADTFEAERTKGEFDLDLSVLAGLSSSTKCFCGFLLVVCSMDWRTLDVRAGEVQLIAWPCATLSTVGFLSVQFDGTVSSRSTSLLPMRVQLDLNDRWWHGVFNRNDLPEGFGAFQQFASGRLQMSGFEHSLVSHLRKHSWVN